MKSFEINDLGPSQSSAPVAVDPSGPTAGINDLTVVICTKDRQEETMRCIASLALLNMPGLPVRVWDDGSNPPIVIPKELAENSKMQITLQRAPSSGGYMAARNALVNGSATEFVLGLDDDAYLLDPHGILEALEEMRNNDLIGSVALCQTDQNDIPQRNQAGQGTVPAFTTHFYGYGWLIRTEAFRKAGGFREEFDFYAEESELSKKMLHHGWSCVWWPAARVAHVPSLVHRSNREVVRCKFGIRNRCLDACLNEPVPLLILTLFFQSMRYLSESRRLRRAGYEIEGVRWLWGSVREKWAVVKNDRQPLSYRVFARWRWVRKWSPSYSPATTP